jgi:hypothetical protein
MKSQRLRAALAMALAALCLAGFLTGRALAAPDPPQAPAARQAPAAMLGIWTSAEDGGSYSTVPGQHPDIANYCLAWRQQWPAQFISQPGCWRRAAGRAASRTQPVCEAPEAVTAAQVSRADRAGARHPRRAR